MTKKSKTSRKRRLLRAAVGFVLLGAGLLLGLLLGLNLWLNTQSFSRLINRKPDKVLIEWSDAKMLVPGRVELQGLRIRGRQRRVHWYVELEQAKVKIDLWALTKKTFRTESLVGDGLRFLIRQRLRDGQDETTAEHYPDIPGVPIEPVAPPPPGPRRPPGWKIQLGGVDVRRLEEVWFNDYRLLGNGQLSGELDFQVRGPMQYEGLALTWSEGRFWLRGDDLASELGLDARVNIEPFVPREAKGLKFLDYLTARLKIDGDFEDVGLLNYYLQHAPDTHVQARGHLSADVGLDRGRLEPGTELLLEAEQLAANFSSFGFEGRGTIEGSVSEPADGEPAVSEMRLSLSDVESHGLSDAPLTAKTGVGVVVRVQDPDFRTGFSDPEVILELPGLLLPDLSEFNALIPDGLGLTIAGGEAEILASVDLKRTEGDGKLQVHGEDILVELNERHLGGDLEVDVRYAGGLTPENISIDGTRFAFGPPNTGDDGGEDGRLWADFTFKDGDLLLTREERHSFAPADGHLVLEGRIADLALLNDYLSYGKWLALHGEVDLDARFHVDDRAVQPGSRVELQADHLVAHFAGWEVGGRATVVGDLPGHDTDRQVELSLDFEEVEIGREGATHFRGPDLRLRASGPELSGGDTGLEDLTVRVDVEQAKILDASLLNEYLPHHELVSVEAGDLILQGHAELAQRAGDARLQLTAEGLEAHLRGEPLITDMMLDLKLRSLDPASRKFLLDDGFLRFHGTHWGKTAEDDPTTDPWEGTFEVVDGEIQLGHPPTIDGSVELKLTDTIPLMHAVFSKSPAAEWFETWLVIHDANGTADVHLSADGMRLDDLKLRSDLLKLDGSLSMAPPQPEEKGHVEELRARGELLKPIEIALEDLNDLLHSQTISFDSGIGELLGHIEVGDDDAEGQLVLTGQELGAFIWGEELITDLRLDIELQSDDMHSHRFDVGGTFVRLDNAHWLNDEYAEHHPGWWAELNLPEGEVLLGKPLTIDTKLDLRLRDSHPLIHLLATKSKPAKWFHRFLEIEDVDGTASLHLGADGLRLDDVLIEGKGLKIEGRLELGEGHHYALFHVVLHHLSAAMELRTDGHDMKLIRAKHWYEERLQAAAE